MKPREKSKITELYKSEYMKIDILPTYIQVSRHYYAISKSQNVYYIEYIKQ